MDLYPYEACGVHGKTRDTISPTRSLYGQSKPSRHGSPMPLEQGRRNHVISHTLQSLESHAQHRPSWSGSRSTPGQMFAPADYPFLISMLTHMGFTSLLTLESHPQAHSTHTRSHVILGSSNSDHVLKRPGPLGPKCVQILVSGG